MTVLIKHKLVDEFVLRNYRIRMDFRELAAAGDLSKTQIKEVLSKKYFLSYKRVENIVYGTNGQKQ